MTLVATALLGAAACVDLFHSTDFDTLCSLDAAACSPETGSSTPDAKTTPDDGDEAGAPPIDFCSNSPSSARRLAERACGWIGACLGSLEQSSYGSCYGRALSAYDCAFNPSLRPRGANAVLWDCLSKVGSCDAVNLCIFGRLAPSCREQDAGSFTACNLEQDGSVVVECAGPAEPVGMAPCALSGQTCAKVDSSKALCAGTMGSACTSTVPQCKDTFAVSCRSSGGIDSDEGLDCASIGEGRCAKDDAGVACAPVEDAGACKVAKTTAVACSDAGVAESCVGGRAVRFNCNALGQTCNESGARSTDPVSACTSSGSPCSNTEDECIGSTVHSCVRGTSFTLDCTTVAGLGPCNKAPGKQAACTR